MSIRFAEGVIKVEEGNETLVWQQGPVHAHSGTMNTFGSKRDSNSVRCTGPEHPRRKIDNSNVLPRSKTPEPKVISAAAAGVAQARKATRDRALTCRRNMNPPAARSYQGKQVRSFSKKNAMPFAGNCSGLAIAVFSARHFCRRQKRLARVIAHSPTNRKKRHEKQRISHYIP